MKPEPLKLKKVDAYGADVNLTDNPNGDEPQFYVTMCTTTQITTRESAKKMRDWLDSWLKATKE